MIEVVPITHKEANAFVKEYHRHHKPTLGCKFCVAVSDGKTIRGVAIVGRPVSRHLDTGWTLEVNRCCTDGSRNACSMLYAASWRAARALGYKRLITYILISEKGKSLAASGWKLIGEAGGGQWNCKTRPRVETDTDQKKLLWDVTSDEPKTHADHDRDYGVQSHRKDKP